MGGGRSRHHGHHAAVTVPREQLTAADAGEALSACAITAARRPCGHRGPASRSAVVATRRASSPAAGSGRHNVSACVRLSAASSHHAACSRAVGHPWRESGRQRRNLCVAGHRAPPAVNGSRAGTRRTRPALRIAAYFSRWRSSCDDRDCGFRRRKLPSLSSLRHQPLPLPRRALAPQRAADHRSRRRVPPASRSTLPASRLWWRAVRAATAIPRRNASARRALGAARSGCLRARFTVPVVGLDRAARHAIVPARAPGMAACTLTRARPAAA